MARYSVVLLPGDGIGPEIVEATQIVLAAAGVEIDWKPFDVGVAALERTGSPLPDEVVEEIRRCGVALKGPIATPIGGGFASVNVALRQRLNLYANLRPVRSLPGVPARYSGVDLVIIRENTEDLYAGIEHWLDDDTAIAVKRITRTASRQIARFAFDYASRHRRRQVTAVHKANILKMSDGLFLQCAREIASQYPQVRYVERLVDALCLDLVLDPERHDVLLCPNLYGDIVSDLAAGLVGGLGLTPAANIGDEVAVFEAVHGSAPDIAGKGIANPTALILASAMMLAHLGDDEAAARVERAVVETYRRGRALPPDVGGTATTREFTQAVVACIA
ncbi:MAG: isocitrate/isopropylmalate dehydrogenase family protein [Anaerolineae bacterium]|nr:isocitrate/isopropylmalate dehydrogenase family protein [Anaerolineae bacterium]MCX8068719.1 isocitrate/isopropylmalate dehydrogenase family protein [Anaerolineae bacterium]MDW7992258.1 isocitrate/isopropylmalate dehydrogenase family protein [Anaerolineae bacterium]